MGLGDLFGKLFGGANSAEGNAAEPAEAIEYNGFTIVAAPFKEGSQYKTAGSITKDIEGEVRSVHFIRADNHADRGSAVTHSQSKAKQIVDEQGEKMFTRDHA